MEQVTPNAKPSTDRVQQQTETKCTCEKLAAWEASCQVCLSLTRSKSKDEKIRVKPGDVIRFRSMAKSLNSEYETGTIKSISDTNEFNEVSIRVFGSLTVLSFIDRFRLLKSYHIPEKR